MPKTKREKPLYQRGKFKLYPSGREGRENYVIIWYDEGRRRERGISTGTDDIEIAKRALDRRYLEAEGEAVCPTCGQSVRGHSPLVASAIADYLVMRQEKPGYDAIVARLNHVLDYLDEIGGRGLICQQIDEEWVERFRKWLQARPIVSTAGNVVRERAISTVENSVLQLRAAINFADKRGARFKSLQPADVNRTPTYRADTETLARMFAYALTPNRKRDSLLSFLRFSVLTLCRPDAALEASTDKRRGQWDPEHEVFNLNPRGRRQTQKFRATVPIAKPGVAWLNSIHGPIVKANTIKTAWNAMAKDVGLPMGDGEGGPKLIRRSMAELMRRKLLVADWPEIEVFMGHDKFDSTTGLYAPLRPDYLQKAKGAVEKVIADIDALVGRDVYRAVTAQSVEEVPEGTRSIA